MSDEEQEALSEKYAFHIPVVVLTTGRIAIFGRFSNDAGLPLVEIVDAAALAERLNAIALSERNAYAAVLAIEDERRRYNPTPSARRLTAEEILDAI